MTAPPLRVAVVGGGITGLAAAFRLQTRLSILGRPFAVTLLERAERFGGPIQTLRHQGFLLETGPDAFLSAKPRGTGLAQELGLSRELIPMRPEYRRSFIAWANKLYPVPEGFYMLAPTQLESVLFSRLLSWRGKLRLLKEPFIPLRPQEDESLGSFVRRRLGPEVLERLAQPLVAGIYAADPDELSLRATFPQFLDLEKQGGLLRNMKRAFGRMPQASGARYSLFVTLKEGLGTFVDRLAEALGPQAARTQAGVSALLPAPDKAAWHISLSDGQSLEAEAVCLALAAPALTRLLAGIDAALARPLGAIPYADSLVAHWGLEAAQLPAKGLDGAGFVVPRAQKRLLGAATLVHHKFAGRVPEGGALIRGFAGGASLAREGMKSDHDLLELLWADLQRWVPVRGRPAFALLHRHQQAMPQYHVGHLARMQELEQQLARWPTLALAGNWRNGIGVPDCIESGERAAESLVNRLCEGR
jgi:oxygen-dependent protoporphyrinogen oxidase